MIRDEQRLLGTRILKAAVLYKRLRTKKAWTSLQSICRKLSQVIEHTELEEAERIYLKSCLEMGERFLIIYPPRPSFRLFDMLFWSALFFVAGLLLMKALRYWYNF